MKKSPKQYPVSKPLDANCIKLGKGHELVVIQHLIVSRLFSGNVLNKGLRYVAIKLILAHRRCKVKPEQTWPW
jgi:uncharacterized Zn ribbon protein